ncbi:MULTISPECIES: ATP-binding protein [unclassified Tolypothrix]|uniref:ATP-binding protein n=1 Tax=unclassified Tolypothrix TaxID=2649714 RepID=UPI0005F867C1|nr:MULTISPECIES: ATP-binding protein [unclassified Tolypothrix]MBE9086012.1 ATP-binding protein [Tolypothrix sp. LEGE 11397]UYD30466.1 ATP-binding protein [Tolypothrix sp. PCC 7712]UYD38400.1 ATP-binding protein [Tolypothrix sp. PCC 7601]
MAVTLKASKQGLETVDQARRKKRWSATAASWCDAAKTSVATLKRFRRGRPIDGDVFVAICKAVGIDNWEAIVDDTPTLQDSRPEFFAFDDAWVGREQLVNELSTKLRGSCRLLLMLGLTGIGKTALAEKLAVEMQDWFGGDWKNRFKRANFDYQDKSTDFASVAARWLEEWEEKVPTEDNKPEKLLQRLVKHLRENQVLVLIDSLEKLLTGNEEDGWSDFVDEWWEKFFLSLLSAESCQSRLIVTSQDLPVKLVDSRYKNFWHRQVLYGLDEAEQEALFEITGLDVSEESPDRPLLMRLGKTYKGHPLVLRVIIGEICESFNGNVQAYWNDISSKIEEVENALAEAEADAKKIVGADDDWKLHKLTRKVRLEVNKQRLKAVFERLESQVKDAYILICAASVYRAPVQEEGWLMQLANLVKRLEHQQCSRERQERALEELCYRFLAEESVNHNNKRVLGQHNLVRSVALERHKQLVQRLKNEAKSA